MTEAKTPRSFLEINPGPQWPRNAPARNSPDARAAGEQVREQDLQSGGERDAFWQAILEPLARTSAGLE